jgi:plastocyanin
MKTATRTSAAFALFTGIALAAHYQVKVGSDGLTFDPQTVDALPGDKVTYSFFPKVRMHSYSMESLPRSNRVIEPHSHTIHIRQPLPISRRWLLLGLRADF